MSRTKRVVKQDPGSLLVVSDAGKMRQLFVPFRVRCVHPLEGMPEGSLVYVCGVYHNRKHRLLFWINNHQLLPYQYFHIEITF